MSAVPELTCSSASREAGEATIGSAPTALAWVCLEQPGPWGPKAFTSSHLDPEIGKAFERSAAAAGVRPQLIRSPGRHPATTATTRTVLIAYTLPGASWLLTGQIENPKRILDLDFHSIAAGIRPDWPELSAEARSMLLVCTNGKRDVCCATLGRDVAVHADSAFPGRVWEASHLSGHRFAATTALLPSGHMHGRVLDGSMVLSAADRGELVATGWRGRSTWARQAQAAELAVRESQDLWDIDAVSVIRDDSQWRVSARERAWTVAVEEFTEGAAPPSCGKVPEPVRRLGTTIR